MLASLRPEVVVDRQVVVMVVVVAALVQVVLLAMKQMRSNLALHCVMNLHRWLRLHLLTDKNHLNLEH